MTKDEIDEIKKFISSEIENTMLKIVNIVISSIPEGTKMPEITVPKPKKSKKKKSKKPLLDITKLSI